MDKVKKSAVNKTAVVSGLVAFVAGAILYDFLIKPQIEKQRDKMGFQSPAGFETDSY